MKRRLRTILWVLILPGFLSLIQVSAAAEEPAVPLQFISLNDGTLIRGRLISIQNGTYIIETEHLGEIHVKPEDVQSISSDKYQRKEEGRVRPPVADNTRSLGTEILNSPNALQAVQQTLISDPQIFSLIQDLMKDPEVVKIVQDSNLMDDISSMDPAAIQQNPDFQRLLQHPKIQQIIKTFTQKHIQLP